jgi:hypothetical protein
MGIVGKRVTPCTEILRPGRDPAKIGGVTHCLSEAATTTGAARSGADEYDSDVNRADVGCSRQGRLGQPGWADAAYKGY